MLPLFSLLFALSDGTRCHDLSIFFFKIFSFKLAFSLSSFTFIESLFIPLHFLPLECYHLHIIDFLGGSDGKASAYNTGDRGSIPGLGRSPGEGSGNPSAYLEVADTSPDNLDSSLWFIQPGILHDVLCIEVKYTGWQYTALLYTFSNFEPVSCSVSGSKLLLDLHISFSGGSYGGLVFPSLEEFSSLLWSTQSKTLVYSLKQK